MKIYSIHDKSRGRLALTDDENYVTLQPGARYVIQVSGSFLDASSAMCYMPVGNGTTMDGAIQYPDSDGTVNQAFECVIGQSGYLLVHMPGSIGAENVMLDFTKIVP